MQFNYYMPVRTIFEAGISNKCVDHIKGDSVLIVCDPFFYQSGTAQKIGEGLTGKKVSYFSDIQPNPTCESVDAGAAIAREVNASCVIGLGGGSSMDVAKMVACLTKNEGSIYDYYANAGGTRTLSTQRAQIVCVPTTAGTGSEVTNVSVFTNTKNGIKMPMVTDMFWPDIALLDPELTYSLPKSVTAACGLDAFCHAIEAYWNPNSQPMCDVQAVDAMKRVFASLETAYNTPSDKAARADMLLASLQAGVAFSQTRTTGAHALSFSLTTDYGQSHGAACAITLPAFIRVSTEKQKDKMESLAKILGCTSVSDLADTVEGLMKRLGLPTRLSEVGVKEENILDLAKAGLIQPVIHLSPAEMTEESICALLKSIL